MISPISFTSTYKVNNQNSDSFYKFRAYALDREFEDSAKTNIKEEFIRKDKYGNIGYEAQQTLIVPDYMDCDVEKFCAVNNISYKKYDSKDLLNPKIIKLRIKDAPKGYQKADINSEKFEKLIQKQSGNIEHCRNDYNNYYNESIDTMLKDGDKFLATTLSINPIGYSASKDYAIKCLENYVGTWGVENLNNGQIMFDFVQKTDSPDQCVYFALKNLGLDKIPVYVDNRAYQAGIILDLFED